ncbi:MAG: hypothetical protein ACSHX0_04820 [Akkermansiaceae bacterium]
MKNYYTCIILAVCFLLGGGLWLANAQSFNKKNQLSYIPNVASVKGSPYGKILAFAMQGPIDFYWHQGQTHGDAEVFNAEGEFECSVGCADCGAHGEGSSLAVSGFPVVSTPWYVNAKEKVRKLSAFTRRRTNNKPLASEHRIYLQSTIEDKLKFAYELDPTNYVNYGNYHIFLSSDNLGGSTADTKRAFDLSLKTLSLCKQESYDPSSWLTASLAAYDVANYIAGNYSDHSELEANQAMLDLDFCIIEYQRLAEELIFSDRYLSDVRIDELEYHMINVVSLRNALQVYMKRVQSDSKKLLIK